MTRSSILVVLLLGLAACESASPAPDQACGGDCANAPTAADGSSGHEFKRVTPSATYPLNACLITGEELGAVEDRVAFSYDGTEVQFCCPGCATKFQSDPETYLAKLAAAK